MFKNYRKGIISFIIVLGMMIMLFSCVGNKTEPLTLTFIHINDSHSHLEGNSFDLFLDDQKTRVKLGGFARTISVIREQAQINENPIILHAGDAISGTIYYSLFKGKSDAEIMNLIEWDAFVLGNHEFDDGNETLKSFLDIFESPTVAANVIPDKSSILAKYWKPYEIVTVQGQKIGIIGIDIVGKTKNSSNPGDDIKFLDEIETTQKYVDILTKKRINKIVVLTHIGHKNAINLAKTVSGIDVVVAGDSHTLLEGEKLAKYNLHAEGKYPTITRSSSGEPVAIVQAWEYTKAVGVLSVQFDSAGIILGAEGNPILPLSDSFLRKNSDGKRVEIEGEEREAVYDQIEKAVSLTIVEPASDAVAIITKYQEEKDAIGKAVIATVAEEIPGGSSVRIPKFSNDSNSKWGHFTAQVVAEGMLYKLQVLGDQVDAVIQNAGGVRIPLFSGDLTTETVYTLLPFGNTLVTIELTGKEIKTALEQSINYALSPEGSTGAFPYTAGIRYDVKLENSKGKRVSNIEIQKNGSWSTIKDSEVYVIGANNYIASGKDGYVIFGEIEESKKIDTYIVDAQCFTDYITYLKTVSKPARTSVNLLQ